MSTGPSTTSLTGRVAVVGPTHPAPGGIVHFTDGLASALQEQGSVLIIGWRRRFPEFLYPGTITDDASETSISATGDPVLDLLNPRSWYTAAQRILEFKPDVAILQWWHPMHAPVVIALRRSLQRAGIPVVIICHNLEPHETNPLWRIASSAALRRAGALVVHSAALTAEAEALAPDVPIIEGFHPVYRNVADAAGRADPSAIEALRAQVGAADHQLLLVFGYVRPYKGVVDAIRAMAHVESHAVLLVAGECWDDPADYVEAARLAGVDDRVTLDLRYIPNDEIPVMFEAANAVLLPYRSATQSGVAALAFAYQRPVIATSVGGLDEVIEEGVNGTLATPCDPVSLAAAIDRALSGTRDWTTGINRTRDELSWTRYVGVVQAAASAARHRGRDPQSHAELDVRARRTKAAKLIRVLQRNRELRGQRVLDIGTGSGTIAVELSKEALAGTVTSIDVIDVRVETDGYEFLTYGGRDLPFEPESFDVVISNHVIEHVGETAAQEHHLREIARVLKPEGTAYVAVPHRWRLVENHYGLPALGWLPQRLADAYMRTTRRGDRYDCAPLGRSQLIEMLSAAGFATRDATSQLIDATVERRDGMTGRALARVPLLRSAIRGPLVPTIVVIGTRR